MMRALALGAMIGLSACASIPSSEAMTDQLDYGDAKVAKMVGHVWREALRAETLKRSGASDLRVIAPGTVVTMDYRPDRLNIETDDQGRITRLKCG